MLAGGWCACSSDDAPEPPPGEPPAPRPVSARGLAEHLRALDTIARENGGERATGAAPSPAIASSPVAGGSASWPVKAPLGSATRARGAGAAGVPAATLTACPAAFATAKDIAAAAVASAVTLTVMPGGVVPLTVTGPAVVAPSAGALSASCGPALGLPDGSAVSTVISRRTSGLSRPVVSS